MFKNLARNAFVWTFVGLLPQFSDVGNGGNFGLAIGGEFNETLSIGDSGPSLDTLVTLDGILFDSKSYQDAQVIVLAFTCVTCPYALDYESRLVAFANDCKKDKKSVAILAVDSNDIPGDSLESMKTRYAEKKYPFEFLKDSGQVVATKFGASKTPEFFVLNRDRKVVYMGAFDDNTDANKVTKYYVLDAVEAVLAGGKIEHQETAAVGCRIRAKRERR